MFHLMQGGVYLPITSVGVAPFRSHRHCFGCELASAKPRSQKAFREAVRTRRVEIANARVVSGVEDLVRPAFQRLDAAVVAEVVIATERDVPGTSDSGQPEPDRRDI